MALEPDTRRRPYRTLVIVLLVFVAVPVLLFAGLRIGISVWTARATDRLVETAQTLLVGTPGEKLSEEALRDAAGGGNVMCMDNCIYLDVEVPAEYAPVVAANVERAGWTVDTPGCLTSTLDGPPCSIEDASGRSIALASYWPGPGLSLMIGPG